MSLILDALQTGRSNPATGAKSTTSTPAQTDAILETLGHGRHGSSAPERVRRTAVYLAAVVFAALLAAALIWPSG